MGAKRPRSVVLGTGALIAFERNEAKMRGLIELAVEQGIPIRVPAGGLAQAWHDGAKQARLGRLIGSGCLSVQSLDLEEAKGAGSICGHTRTADVIDAGVVLLARRHSAVVVTSNPHDFARLDPNIQVEVC